MKTYILNRPDGSKVKLEPHLQIDELENEAFDWICEIYYCAPDEEKFTDIDEIHFSESGSVDKLSEVKQIRAKYVTDEEIHTVMVDLFEFYRP